MDGRELVYLDTLALAAVTFGGFAVIAGILTVGFLFNKDVKANVASQLPRWFERKRKSSAFPCPSKK